jgi:CBS domain-containing protein
MRLCDLPRTNEYKVKAEEPLVAAISALSRGSTAVLVVDEGDKLRGLITVSRALGLLPALTLSSKIASQPVGLFVSERAATMHYEYPVEAALQLMVEEGRSHLVLVDGLRAVGLLTHRCFLRGLLGSKLDLDLRRLMARDVVTLLAHNSLAEAYRAMTEMNYYEVPIVEEEVVGVVRLRDVIGEVATKGFEGLKLVKVYSKCKLVERGARRFDEALELAFKEDLNLVPVLKDDGSYGFMKLEDLFMQLVRELGAFKVTELMSQRFIAQSVRGA